VLRLGVRHDAQIASVMRVIATDQRIPANFAVFYNPAHPGELAHVMPERLASDSRGIDHPDDYSTPEFQANLEDVATALYQDVWRSS
jgi:hypothetical protein